MIKERILTVETIGEPNIDKLPKDIKMVFFQTLLDEAIEYYKNEKVVDKIYMPDRTQTV